MMVLACIMALLSAQGGSFRIGLTFDAGFPQMSAEKDYAELLNEGGLDFRLNDVAWTGGIEALGDVSEKVRLRGSISVSRFTGTYEEGYDPLAYILIGIFTGGLGFIFGPPPSVDEVIALEDQAVNIEASAYYKLVQGPVTLSVGGGPAMSFISRRLDTPNTSVSDNGSALGFTAGLRLDGEPGSRFLGCLPIVLGAEGGYRFCKAELDGENSQDFQVDFSGPYIRVGSYFTF